MLWSGRSGSNGRGNGRADEAAEIGSRDAQVTRAAAMDAGHGRNVGCRTIGGTASLGPRWGAMILRRELVFSICAGPQPERLARAMVDLCERSGLEPCEAEGVIAEALTWPPGSRDPEPLLQRYRMPS